MVAWLSSNRRQSAKLINIGAIPIAISNNKLIQIINKGGHNIEYLILGLIKFVDNAISTTRNIFLYKGRYFISSVLVFISTIIFCMIVSGIAKSNNIKIILVIALASALGSYVSGKTNEYFQKDKLYINIITCGKKEELKILHNFLTDNKIKHILFHTYDLELESGLTIEIFCKTKHESKILDKYFKENNNKFLRNIIN